MLMCKFSESVKLGGVKNDTGRKVDIKIQGGGVFY